MRRLKSEESEMTGKTAETNEYKKERENEEH